MRTGLALLPAADLWQATEPLFVAGEIEAIEFNIDQPSHDPSPLGRRIASVLDDFAEQDALYAHGVELSLFSAEMAPYQEELLAQFERECTQRRYRHLSEHYGFMTAGEWVRGTPLPLPPSQSALELGITRLTQLRQRTGIAVGLENLGFAWSRDDALAQADFVGQLLLADPSFFLLLDLHNLLCQAENFDIDPLQLAERYPLQRVRELHLAGGAIAKRADGSGAFRRDSHDHELPSVELTLLTQLLPRCPHLEVVIVERSDRSLFGAAEAERFRRDYRTVRELVRNVERGLPDAKRPEALPPIQPLVVDDLQTLSRLQTDLLGVLYDVRPSAQEVREVASAYPAWAQTFEPRAIEIARAMVREWAQRPAAEHEMLASVHFAAGLPLSLIALPKPSPGPHQVLLRVMAVGLCGTDAHATRGEYPVPTPIVLGHESVGIIERVGTSVQGFQPGDRVGVSWVQAGCGSCPACSHQRIERCESAKTWMHNGGGLSEFMIAEASGLTHLPEALTFEHAAPLFCAGHVVAASLRRAHLAAGERLAVLGLGGLGHLAVMLGRHRGHEVVVLTRSQDKQADATVMGAQVIRTNVGDLGTALEADGGADVIVSTSSNAADIASMVAGLRPGGRLLVVGLCGDPLPIDALQLVSREASIVGAVQGPRSELVQLLDEAARGGLAPWVETYPLYLAERALGRLREGRTRYRAVVTPF